MKNENKIFDCEIDLEKFYLKQLVDNLPEFLFWKDKNSVFLGCNKNFASMAGLSSPREIVGKTDYDLPWSKEESDSYRADDLQVIQSGEGKYNIEESQTNKFGQVTTLLTNKIPLYDQQGNISGVVGIYANITELKNTQLRLQKEKIRAEAASRAKTEFLGSISHDMKSPLVGIVSSAEIIAYDQHMPEKARYFSTVISDSGKQLESFFTSCLDLSKLEMEEWASRTSVFSIKKLMNDVHSLYLPRAMSSHLHLHVEYDESLPQSVEGHRDSLYRVLLNLLGNALKFTEQGDVTLRVFRGESIDDQSVNVIFEVQDTGVGIPEDKHKVIFEKLRRLTPSYESKIEGSGIGLYIVDQYVKRIGGSIKVKSKVGDGSTFIVTVPLKISAYQSRIEVLPQSISQLANTNSFDKKIKSFADIKSFSANEAKTTDTLTHVLVVEDADLIQLVTKTLLNEIGFSVDIAATGEDAVEMFEPGKYGLVYMDIGLPKMNGYETTKAIREKEKALKSAVQIPIIALTGHGAVDVKKFCGEAGMQGILSKPLSREQAEKVWQFYGQHQQIDVPGLTSLEKNDSVASENDILDIDLSTKRVGSKEVATKMIADFIQHLQTQFLPIFKNAIENNARAELRFHLHQQLGSLAYVEAPLLQQALLSAQKIVKNDEALTSDLYQEIEKAVMQLIECYKKSP